MAILNHGSTLRTADGGQTTTTIVTASNIGTYGVAANSTYYVGTTQNVFNRASGVQTLTGVSIDGNAANITAYTINQNVGSANTPSFAGMNSTAMLVSYTSLTNGDDWSNSPISIRERGLVSAAQSINAYSPNLNFHWGSRISNSLWMDANGNLAWGSYSETGVPSSDGAFYAANLYASIYYDKNDTTYYLDPANTGTSLLVAGKVGIGTTSPTTKLAVSDGTTIAQVNPSSGVAYFGTVNNYPMALSVNSSEKVRILNDGSVGIGTTSPTAKLHIVQANSGGVAAILLSSDESTIQGPSANTQIRMGGNLVLNGSNITTLGTNNTTRITIDNSGNVGIGATAPDTNLQVVGHVHVGNQTTFENAGGWNKTIYLDGLVHSRLRILGSAYASGKNSSTETYLWVDNSVAPYSGLATNAGSFQISAGFTTILNSARSPLFYDSDNTAYYIDAASTSNLVGLTVANTITGSISGNAATATNVAWSGITSKPTTFSGFGITDLVYGSTGSRNVWTVTNWNQTTYPNAHFLSSEGNTTNAPSTDFIYGLQTAFHRDGASYRTQMVSELYSSPVSIWVRNSRDSDVWTTWSKLLHSNNYSSYSAFTASLTSTIDARAPIFYDSNDTTYYIDPASTSRVVALWVRGSSETIGNIYVGGTSAGNRLNISYDQIWTPTAHLYLQYSGAGNIDMNYGGGVAFSRTSLRAPIFYDFDNTAYYTDPASTSSLNALTMAGTITGALDSTISFAGGACTAASYNYILSGANDGGNKLVIFVNGTTRSADGGVNALTIRNDGGTFVLGYASYLTSILGSSVTINGNVALHAGNYGGYSAFSGSISSGGNITATGYVNVNSYVYSATYLQTGGNLIYPSGFSSTQRLEVGNSANNNWIDGLTIAPGGTVTAPDNMRSPIFYDSNNTAYYLDPANSGTSLLVAGKVGIGTTSPGAPLEVSGASGDGVPTFKITSTSAPSTFNYAGTMFNSSLGASKSYSLMIGKSAASKNSGYIGYNHSGTDGSNTNFLTFGHFQSDYLLNILGNGNVGIGTTSPANKLHVVGSAYSDTDFRAPIFYDSNDTTYYIDPANGGFNLRGGTSNRVTFNSGDSGIIITNAEGISSNVRLGCAWGRPGIYNGSSITVGAETQIDFVIGNVLRAYVDSSSNLFGVSSVRAPIFYDSNNTAFYTDPASTSVLNNIRTATISAANHGLTCVYYGGGATPTNGYLITTNIDYSTFNMPTVIIEGYAYGNGVPIHLEIVWYAYNNSWTNLAYTNLGNWNPGTVSIGTNASGKVCLHLSSLIYYGRFNVRCIYDGGNAPLEGWTVTDATTSALTRVTTISKVELATSITGNAATTTNGLTTSNYVSYSAFSGSVTSTYGNFTTPGLIIGDAQYGFYVVSGNVYYKSASGGIHYWRNIANNANTMSLDNSGNLTAAGYLQTTSNLIYPSTYGVTQRLEVSNAANNAWIDGLTIAPGGIVTAYGDSRAPIFYDSANTAYYCDPNGVSSLFGVAIRGDQASTNTNNQIFFWDAGNTTTSAIGFKANGGSFANPTGNGDGYNTYLTMDADGRGWVFRRGVGGTDFTSAYTAGWILNNGVWQANASMRAPIFYDSNNTAYYVDPASTSNLNNVAVAGTLSTNNIAKNSAGSPIVINSGLNASLGLRVYYDMNLYNTLVFTDSSWNSQGSISGSGSVVNIVAATATTTFTKYAGHSQEGGSFRAPIFYDSNDTGYYCDPTSNSVLNGLYVNAYYNLSNDYKDINVYGDVNTYYVVLIQGEYLYSFGRYSVTRGYNWTGPDTWYIATHKGGLTLDWEWSGDTAWGGNDKAIRIIEFNESYSTMVAGLGYPVNGGVIIWLRGGGVGGAQYRIRTPIGSNATVTVYDGVSATNHSASTSFTAANSAVFSTRADVSNVSGEILARYPVRSAASLYNDNNLVVDTGSSTQTKSGIFASAASVRAPIFYDTDNTAYYVDPNSTSNLVGLTVANTITGSISGNSGTVGGLSIHSGRNNEANKVVRTDSNGYIQAGWINTTSGDNGTSAIDRVYASGDGYIRYYTPANFRTVLDVPTRGGSGASGSWGISVTGSSASCTGNAATVTTNANLTGHITSVGNATSLGSFTSAQLLAALTDETGTGANVFATSPTLVSPALGTPSSGNLANCTFPTLNQNTTGSSASCTGNSVTATSATFLNASNYIQRIGGSGNYNTDFQNTPAGSVRHQGDDATSTNNPGGTWWFVDNYKHSNSSSHWGTQVAWGWEDNANRLATRNVIGGSFGGWVYYLNSANYTSYAIARGGDTLDGVTLFRSNKGATSTVGANNTYGLQAYSSDAGAAGMSFHRGGHYAINMGLDPDNVFRIGGWSASSNRLQLDTGGNLTVATNMYANGFYDNNNTALYCDPNGTSLFTGLTVTNTITGSITGNAGGSSASCTGNSATTTLATKATRANGNFYIDDNYGNTVVGVYSASRYQGVYAMGDSYKLAADGSTTGSLYGIAWSHPNAGGAAGNLSNHGALILLNGGYAAAISSSIRCTVDMRTPIYYDSDNTSYYIDAGSTSYLYVLSVASAATAADYYTAGWFRSSTSGNGMYNQVTGQHFYSDSANYWNVASSASEQGIRLRTGGHAGTVRGYFYADTNNDVGLLNQAGSWRVRVVGGDYVLFDGSSIRAQIFYDSNDTGYYIDAASTSILNVVRANSYVQKSASQSLSGTVGCTIDVAAAGIHVLTLAASTTISSFTYNYRAPNPSVNTIMLVIKYGGTASITWTNVLWANGVTPTITGVSGYADVYMLTSYQGTTGVWIGTVVSQGVVSTSL